MTISLINKCLANLSSTKDVKKFELNFFIKYIIRMPNIIMKNYFLIMLLLMAKMFIVNKMDLMVIVQYLMENNKYHLKVIGIYNYL